MADQPQRPMMNRDRFADDVAAAFREAARVPALEAEVVSLRRDRDQWRAFSESLDVLLRQRAALVSRLRSRLARVCAYAERASFSDCVKRERCPTTNEIANGTQYNRGGEVWSRRVPGGRRTGGERA